MPTPDILDALKESYKEVQSRKSLVRRVGRLPGNVEMFRRYLLYASDILDIYLNIQRDRRWNRNEF